MRLINTATLELEDHLEDIPQYAILSHTWGDEEVTLQDWTLPSTRDHLLFLLRGLENGGVVYEKPQGPSSAAPVGGTWREVGDGNWRSRLDPALRLDKFGYWKILKTCLLARKEGFNYLWADTNCIDKTSSADLSEAINSMYAWYRGSSICYVYMSDVRIAHAGYSADALNLHGSSLDSFRQSRWFRRGWTLQELLAPRAVRFYSGDWTPIGTKARMAPLLSEITRIDEKYLRYTQDIRSASIAQRMAAVADRMTTRPEDIAYCLLGLFNINMPLLYGEGAMAFVRLQEEIIKISDDHSIFAWTWIAELTTRTTARSIAARHSHFELDYKPNFPANRIRGLLSNRMKSDIMRPTLLALDPVCFFDSGAVPELRPPRSALVLTMTNVGLSISLPIFGHPGKKSIFAVIHEEKNPEDGTRVVTMVLLTQHYRYRDRWTRVPFPAAPVTVALRSGSRIAPSVETIQVCRDTQHSPFYYDAFGGTSHEFGFWLVFPRPRDMPGGRISMVDGCILGNGVYNSHCVLFSPEEGPASQVMGGLLMFRVNSAGEEDDAWHRRWHNTVVIAILVLEVERAPGGGGRFRRISRHHRVVVMHQASVHLPGLLKRFVADLREHPRAGWSAEPCSDSMTLEYGLLHASVEFLGDAPLSHAPQSEITLTTLNIWSTERGRRNSIRGA
ncbi:putative vegetative incompatibility protein HET-E-1 [Rosellinia necatrix]|uniref:Putative vegetative incompatibility protein HET-E-1 n=1 Tax=Rosellinia necatrix TaxID=77044 RepID=A0A1W2TCP4_ROSNE|nr:putative vegetative incompatibility protein HET-E-1 [Rosellinia necatrix]